MRFNGTNEIKQFNLVYKVGMMMNGRYHSWLFEMVSSIPLCHSWVVINGIFKTNPVLLIAFLVLFHPILSGSIPFCPVPSHFIPFCPISFISNNNLALACQGGNIFSRNRLFFAQGCVLEAGWSETPAKKLCVQIWTGHENFIKIL